MDILIGTDPELFVKNDKDEFVSAHDLIPGTKDNPYLVGGGAVQVDGVAAEFNTNPASSEDEFLENINRVRTRLNEMVQEVNPSYHLVAEPTATFTKEYFGMLPPEAVMLGCTPDYDAYTGKQNIPPETTEPFRTGAGHIHVGWTMGVDPLEEDHFKICCELVKQLDAVLYPLSHTWDSDTKRRTLYGKRGSFRPKFYGVEWRPLSNAYLREERTIRLVYRAVFEATRLYFDGVKLYE